MFFKMFWQVLLLPLRIWYFIYIKLRSLKKISFIEFEIKGKLNDSPLTSGLLSLLKPPVDRFYLKMLGMIQLNDLLELKRSKLRQQLKEILVVIKEADLGWSKAWEIKDILENLKKKVRVRVYLESGTPLAYLAALGGDEIYIPPALDLYLVGSEMNTLFYNRFLTKFAIKPNFLKIGRYKGASEKYTRTTFSPPNRQQFKELLNDLQNEYEASLRKSRLKKIGKNYRNKKDLLTTLQKKAPYTSKSAFHSGLVDGVLYLDELKETLEKKHGIKSPKFLPLSEAIKRSVFKQKKLINLHKKKKVAFIVGEGIILNSKEPNPKAIAYEDYIKTIRQVKKQDHDAVILRWNSPGGSALVSDMLWAGISQLKNSDKKETDPWKLIPRSWKRLQNNTEKKADKKEMNKKQRPVYVSQSDVAASGGYYLSALSRQVYSSPVSITGSIGVISGKFNIQAALKKFGIDTGNIAMGGQSDILSPYSNFTPNQIKALENNMKSMYELFINRIQRGRKMTVKKIKPLAEGRVYSGKKAHKLGLVDHIGGLRALLIRLREELEITPEDTLHIEILPKIKKSFPQNFARSYPLLTSWLDQLKVFKHLNKEKTFFLDDNFL